MICEVCKEQEHKYTCPSCSMKTCSLKCCKEHKELYKCSGVRDKTKFVKLDEYNEKHMLNDYRFLEEQSRVIDSTHRDTLKRKYDHTASMDYLRKLAFSRYKVNLKFMPRHSTKRLENRTRFDKQTRSISWHIALQFHATDKTVYHLSDLCSSDDTLRQFLKKFYQENSFKLFMPGQILSRFNEELKNLSENEHCNLNVLFEVRDFRAKKRYHVKFEINNKLEECLFRKIVVEYPVLVLALMEDLNDYTVVSEVVKQKEAMRDEEKEEGELDDADEQDEAEDGEVNDDDDNLGEMSMLELGTENEDNEQELNELDGDDIEDYDDNEDDENGDESGVKKLKIEQLFDIDFSKNADNDFESGVKIEKL